MAVKELPEFFTEYCPEPYDKHEYKVYFKNGKAITFPDFVMMRQFWFQHCKNDVLSHVIVVDKVQRPVKKGF